MSVIRVNKTKDYTIISNFHLKDKNLSLKAKGLLSVMLSLPEDWCYSIDGLVNICKENETAINSTLKELKVNNYLVVTKLMPNQTQTGRIEYIYDIYETPKQEFEKQDLEILGVENQGQLNTNNINTNNQEDNNKNINITNKENTKRNDEIIFEHWNSKNIIVHRDLTEKRKKAIAKALKEHSTLDIILAIDHFEEMLHSKYEYCDYAWSLEEFLTRDKGFTEFLDDGSKWLNYLNWKKKQKDEKPVEHIGTYLR